MTVVGGLFLLLSVAILVGTWLGYPLWLRVRTRRRPAPRPRMLSHDWWPSVTIVVVVHNAEATLRSLLDNLLATIYRGDRRRILVVSDASTDLTDTIARLYQHRGVELLRIMRRRGYASALNYARKQVRDDIVVVMDADARVAQASLTALVAPFADESVGVTFGHELAIEAVGSRRGRRESPYTRYERLLRERESRLFGTVSARDTFYAMRGELFTIAVPVCCGGDFISVMRAAEYGYRALHVASARYVLTRPRSLRRHYARVVLAVSRDVVTLMREPRMLSAARYGDFARMLLGHKVGRWLTPWAMVGGFAGLVLLAPSSPLARVFLGIYLVIAAVAAVLAFLPARTRMLRRLALPGQVAATAVAIGHASLRALRARTAVRRGLEPALG